MKKEKSYTCDECGYPAVVFNPEDYPWQWTFTHGKQMPIKELIANPHEVVVHKE